jgi:8-oxo-dGTP diphosphatase
MDPDVAAYDPRAYPAVAVTVDLVLLTLREGRLRVLLVRRAENPFQGTWALPGGFVRPGEDLDAAAARELAEETGIRLEEHAASERPGRRGGHLEQLRTYGDPTRDPRMRVVSVAYLALLPDLPAPRAGGDADESAWATLDGFAAADRTLAFDHDRILADGVERARAKLEYTTLAAAFCGSEFTVADLRRVYETVWGTELDPRNFHRKATGTDDFLVPLDRSTARGAGRPAQLYRAGTAEWLTPPLLRPLR